MKNIKAGFSLVEIVITIMLIAIVAIVALSFIVYCNRLVMQAGRRTIAANFVRETMEDLYKREYGDTGLNATVDQPYPLPAGTAFGGEFLARYPTATRKYTITENPDYKLITVKVTWN